MDQRSSAPVVGIVSLGNMGGWIARRLNAGGVQVKAVLSGRSDDSRARAVAAGVALVSDYSALLLESDIVMSVVPPDRACQVADSLALASKATLRKPTYLDLNAVNSETVKRIEERICGAGSAFIDGCIIGAAPEGLQLGPRIYVSGQAADIVEKLNLYGLDVRVLNGRIGSASSLKCCFAGLSKGVTALAIEIILASQHSGVTKALIDEFATSLSGLSNLLCRSIPDSFVKSERWVGEMMEISSELKNIPGGELSFRAAAEVFSCIAESSKSGGRNGEAAIHAASFIAMLETKMADVDRRFPAPASIAKNKVKV